MWAKSGSNDGRFEDPLLTAKGLEQAELLAAYLAGAREPSVTAFEGGPLRGGLTLTHLYTSLMRRAIQTGSAVSRAVDLPLEAWPEIHERGGIYLADPQTGEEKGLPGQGRAFFETRYPHLALPHTLGEEGWWNRPYETREDALLRATSVLQLLMERHGGTEDHVAFVTHGGFTQSLLQIMFGIAANGSDFSGERFVWLKSNNGAISRIDVREEMLRLAYLNFIDYMPGELLT